MPADEFVLERPDGGLGQGVVVAVADGADRSDCADVAEAQRVADRGVLRALVAMVHDTVGPGTSVKGLLERFGGGLFNRDSLAKIHAPPFAVADG